MERSGSESSPPLVSIIINNYNYGCYIGSAIRSALCQSYRRVEVIVVDDGSTDISRCRIASFGNRVIPVLKSNGGQASAFNAGFEKSRGEVIIFLDADDMLLPDTAARAAAAFRADPEVVRVQYPLAVVDSNGVRTGSHIPARPERLVAGDLRLRVIAFPDDIPWQPTSGNALRTGVLREIFPIPEEDYRICADYYVSNLSALFGSVVSLDEVGGCYRIHDKNLHHRSEFKVAEGREIITRTSRTHAHLKRFADDLGLSGFPDESGDVRSVTFLAHRILSRKLEPIKHPIPGDTLPALLGAAVRAAFGRFDVPLYKRAAMAAWFAAVVLAPRPATLWLARAGLGR